MCGRFAFFQEIEPLLDDLDAVDLTGGALHHRFNIPPTVPIHVVTEGIDRDTGELVRALRIAKWGLLPPFARDEAMSARTFNARRETLIEKPSFRSSLGKYRAIVPLSGYFEWQQQAGRGKKQPFFIHRNDDAPLYAAGLVSWWKGPRQHEGPAASADHEWLLTATIITQAAQGHLSEIHDRSPVFLTHAGAHTWLTLTSFDSGAEAHAWINSEEERVNVEDIARYPVSARVGNVREQGPSLIDPER